MSNEQKNDLDEQLFILLASMKEYREAIADDKKRLDQFYKYVGENVVQDIKRSLDITQSNAAVRLESSADNVLRSASRLNNRFIILYSAAFISLVCIFILAIFLFIPSFDEIKQRRAEVNNLKQYSLDLSKCEGKTCVKIMKKQCGYGKNSDYCVIDPK